MEWTYLHQIGMGSRQFKIQLVRSLKINAQLIKYLKLSNTFSVCCNAPFCREFGQLVTRDSGGLESKLPGHISATTGNWSSIFSASSKISKIFFFDHKKSIIRMGWTRAPRQITRSTALRKNLALRRLLIKSDCSKFTASNTALLINLLKLFFSSLFLAGSEITIVTWSLCSKF